MNFKEWKEHCVQVSDLRPFVEELHDDEFPVEGFVFMVKGDTKYYSSGHIVLTGNKKYYVVVGNQDPIFDTLEEASVYLWMNHAKDNHFTPSKFRFIHFDLKGNIELNDTYDGERALRAAIYDFFEYDHAPSNSANIDSILAEKAIQVLVHSSERYFEFIGGTIVVIPIE